MIAWREHSQAILRHSTNLGSAREHFVKEVLSRFLPSSVVIAVEKSQIGKRGQANRILLFIGQIFLYFGDSTMSIFTLLKVQSQLSR